MSRTLLRFKGEWTESGVELRDGFGHNTKNGGSSYEDRKPFWSLKPSAALFWSAMITKILATFVAVYGWYVAPLGWKLALFVSIYALGAFVVTDLTKVRFDKLLEHKGVIFRRQKTSYCQILKRRK